MLVCKKKNKEAAQEIDTEGFLPGTRKKQGTKQPARGANTLKKTSKESNEVFGRQNEN